MDNLFAVHGDQVQMVVVVVGTSHKVQGVGNSFHEMGEEDHCIALYERSCWTEDSCIHNLLETLAADYCDRPSVRGNNGLFCNLN